MVSTRSCTTTKKTTKPVEPSSKAASKNQNANQKQSKKSGKRVGGRELGRDKTKPDTVENQEYVKETTEAESGIANNTSFWPDVVFGDETKGLSKIERADLRICQWESILKTHEENLPEAVATCQAMLTRARDDRISLEADPANHIIVDETKRDQVVRDRIKVLQQTLDTAEFEPERVNIKGAIAAYESEKIVYSKQYTLIWGGRVVDRADSYGEFTVDRLTRLDRYAEKYGPDWLWWESPLWLEPSQRIIAHGSQILNRDVNPTGFGHFHINQGFRKRSDWVTRMRQSLRPGVRPAPCQDQIIEVGDTVFCQLDGPKLVYRSLLDSGASHPSLFRADFEALGIAPEYYGAQSVVSIMTSNGIVDRRIYEMHVEIVGNGNTPMIDSQNPLRPANPTYIGGLSPVVFDDRHQIGQRLSGVMPFLASYMSITPGLDTIFMGENRNDVLGLHKMPPQRNWHVNMTQNQLPVGHWLQYDNPLITFSHKNGTLIDEDLSPELTKLTVNIGQLVEKSYFFDAKNNDRRIDVTRMSRVRSGGPGVLSS